MSLVAAAAFAQADQPAQSSPSPPPASQPSATQQTPVRLPAKKPQSLADVARSSKQAYESAPPTKVYRNKDVRDPAEEGSPVTPNSGPAVSASHPAPPKSAPPAKTAAAIAMEKEAAFEAQGKVLRSQVLAQKARIVGVQNSIRQIQNQFADWTTWYTDDGDVSLCWTNLGDTYYYKSYCDVGKNLRAQIEAAQRQLAQERTKLENMQEDIRLKGYGNSIYEPD